MKFEYMEKITDPDDVIRVCNIYGEKGWELASIIVTSFKAMSLFFKRELVDKDVV